ncbi:MAG: 16S rRNA (cytosine(1402)-N(4))-methyltransferase RsmH [Oligoflexia bacterium]|nr:16S rRNA (cytosine(1402)-N(4))-methyltransferase RsmH [Oligoflexia bacterium]
MSESASCHIAVLEQEVLNFLNASRGGTYLDCTLGGGGHTRAILASNPENMVIAVDRDLRAIERTQVKLQQYSSRLKIVHGEFARVAKSFESHSFDGILADLGLSSDQLAEGRGFSFNDAGPLDMRMNEEQELSAASLINDSERPELLRILRQGGAEQEAERAVAAIMRARPISDTAELARVLREALAGHYRGKKIDPATVVFQALRIAVNQELQELETLLESLPALAKPHARAVFISFHSLEDRAVAGTMRRWAQSEFSANWPGAASAPKPIGKILTRKAVTAAEAELSSNPRSRSAKLRAFEFN